MTTAQAMLEISDISINFGGLKALANVSFSVEEGEIVSLIGPNGAGKTTLLNIVSGELAPTNGWVQHAGKEIQNLPPQKINAQGVGRTFQAAEVFSKLSVRDNVITGGVAASGIGFLASINRWGRARTTHEKLTRQADEALKFVGLSAQGDMPAASLPAGQQRLLGIARMMVTGAHLMLLDEPGAGLNETEKSSLVDVIGRLAKAGNTILLVEHDMGVVGQLSDRIVVLDQGILIADGTPGAVKKNPKVIEAYLGKAQTDKVVKLKRKSGQDKQRMCDIADLTVRYDGVTALRNVSAHINDGEIVALVGPNGAGKSSLIKAIVGFVKPAHGTIKFEDEDIAHEKSPDAIVRKGISLTPEGRELFPSLSVSDNLSLGHYAARISAHGIAGLLYQGKQSAFDFETRRRELFELFPILAERRDQQAGTLSGGQGQMLAIARSLMSNPKLLVLDEPSLGLAPQVVDEILHKLVELRAAGLTILLIEQNARAALQIADRAYVLSSGEIVASGTAEEILADEETAQAYLGWDQDQDAAGKSLRSAV
jgi:branched-chain amino acid transport system ATP-binding protein